MIYFDSTNCLQTLNILYQIYVKSYINYNIIIIYEIQVIY